MALRTAAARPTRTVPTSRSFVESDNRYVIAIGAGSATRVIITGAATTVAAVGVTAARRAAFGDDSIESA